MNHPRILGLVCVSVLAATLSAGLVPFQRPRNGVTWLEHRNGLHFRRFGTVVSSREFPPEGAPDESSCSLEIWLQSGATHGSSTLIAFSTPENPLQLWVHQYRGNLVIKRMVRGVERKNGTIGIEGIFGKLEPIFITIASGAHQTSIYVDGSLAGSFPNFRIENDCSGQLVAGTSPVGNDTWSGQLLGLAIYRRDLTSGQVLQHYERWTARGRPEISENDKAVAVYLFDEHDGRVVHNAVPGGVDLTIPSRYSLLHQTFLEPFWKEFKPTRSYWNDVLINIVGFVPLGFVFCAYWSSARPLKHSAVVTVVLGFVVSLTIEILQGYLPTRSSGTTDLITNTLGTFLGVRLYAWEVSQALLAKIN